MNYGKGALCAAALLLVLGPAEAGEVFPGDFSATVGFATDYTFRGISQTDENPAIQGSIDWAHESGVYLGVWGSNVDFNDGDEAQLEMDFYGGIAGEVSGITWDVGVIYYAYPGADDDLDYDYVEGKGALGYDFGVASVEGSVFYSPEYFGDSGDAVYAQFATAVPLPYGFGVNGLVGYQWIDENATFGVPDYLTWTIGLTYSLEGFDFALSYVDTDLSSSECNDICDARAMFAVSRSF